jgi:hypothetical protein
MRIGILLPTNIYFAPYAKIYTDVLDELGVKYDIIYFDKRNLDEPAAYRFSAETDTNSGQLKRLINYLRYSLFLRKIIKKERYDKLIVCGPQIGIFLYGFLKKYYNKKFILDYRDLSIEQRFKRRYKALLDMSAYNMISSPGFKRCLPKEFDYILSHNFSIDILTEALQDEQSIPTNLHCPDDVISVLTIGGIRDYEQNAAVMTALANNPSFSVSFIGRGEENADVKLKDLAQKNHYSNVHFQGFYQKQDEPNLISHATFLNIFYPRKLSHDTALSNRFYSSLIFRKPMITTADTIQGDYASKYGVGVAIKDTENLSEKLENYVRQYKADEYEKNRRYLLESFLDDYKTFKKAILEFVEK